MSFIKYWEIVLPGSNLSVCYKCRRYDRELECSVLCRIRPPWEKFSFQSSARNYQPWKLLGIPEDIRNNKKGGSAQIPRTITRWRMGLDFEHLNFMERDRILLFIFIVLLLSESKVHFQLRTWSHWAAMQVCFRSRQ